MDEQRRLARERKMLTRLPVIDLAPFVAGGSAEDRRAVAQKLREACIDIGFFYLSGHGIAQSEFDAVIAMGHRFFELPLAEKMKLHSNRSAVRLGYRPLGGPNPGGPNPGGPNPGGPNPGGNGDKPPDLKERFHMAREVMAGEPEEGRRDAGLSQWPEAAVLPGFTAMMRAHIARRCDVARHLARAFALSLDLAEDAFDAIYRYPGGSVVFNYYPPIDPKTHHDGEWSFSPHADYNAFTLLYQDQLGGLQVMNAAGAWIDVPFVAGTMVVNIGDLFQSWTNDLYTSTLHRVHNQGTAARISVPHFASPNGAAMIECLPSCTGPGNPPRYAPIRAEDFVAKLLAEAYRTGLPALGAKTAERLKGA
ncbi:MAG TPA: 2-oxoglutarate and iron-dependent oxygenase domain-containing protein [Stellaceae bacterium]|jgi:isopenicillin N synthase-like dioxygenase|nr:2-oxoglutarate and iron-dependent oxygenase domain-containing protein [Stellaceae bacterium]